MSYNKEYNTMTMPQYGKRVADIVQAMIGVGIAGLFVMLFNINSDLTLAAAKNLEQDRAIELLQKANIATLERLTTGGCDRRCAEALDKSLSALDRRLSEIRNELTSSLQRHQDQPWHQKAGEEINRMKGLER